MLLLVISLIILVLFHGLLLLTNPYARLSIIKQPFTTRMKGGDIVLDQHFRLHASSNRLIDLIGYYKSGLLILQNTFFGPKALSGDSADEIINAIHHVRFDPSKPYLISGDQFSVLYVRNLGVFYNSLLVPDTAHDQQDWEHRQRIYLQSAAYAIEALSQAKRTVTTVVPIGPRTAALTQVHPGSVGSDTVYGLLYALNALTTDCRSEDGHHRVQTLRATRELLAARSSELRSIVERYLDQVQDPETGMIRSGLHLASARDGVVRDRSFYDNVVLWKTLQLADKLAVKSTPKPQLESIRQDIIAAFWNEARGCFRDEIDQPNSYSSDWLIALPTGFLTLPEDRIMLERCVASIRTRGAAKPLPIKYEVHNQHKAPWAVRTFVPSYGGNAIWSYWGAEYLTLLAKLHHDTGKQEYYDEAAAGIEGYKNVMVECGGFPETLDSDGTFLKTHFYKSIRVTGWVVQFEYAMWLLSRHKKPA